MPLARIAGKILYFAHIPKTGGSSVEAYLQTKGPLALKFQRRMGWSKSSVQHMQAAIHQRIIPDDFFDHSFTVLRDPVARMVSEYRYRQDRNKNNHPFDRWVSDTIAKSKELPYHLDNHARPQIDFLRPGMQMFKFEDGLDSVFDWIDSVTDQVTGKRNIWEKKSAAATVDVDDKTRAAIEKYYADDVKLMAGLASEPTVF